MKGSKAHPSLLLWSWALHQRERFKHWTHDEVCDGGMTLGGLLLVFLAFTDMEGQKFILRKIELVSCVMSRSRKSVYKSEETKGADLKTGVLAAKVSVLAFHWYARIVCPQSQISKRCPSPLHMEIALFVCKSALPLPFITLPFLSMEASVRKLAVESRGILSWDPFDLCSLYLLIYCWCSVITGGYIYHASVLHSRSSCKALSPTQLTPLSIPSHCRYISGRLPATLFLCQQRNFH